MIGIGQKRLRVGVTGHRSLPGEAALVDQVRYALDRATVAAPGRGPASTAITILSPLAEGADRLVARIALDERQARLEAVLPLAPADYCADFATAQSRQEFEALLARAAKVVALPPVVTREAAYEQAGRYIVEHADVLIALWDGEPARGQGGTADTVGLARERGLPLLWIVTRPPFTLYEERWSARPSSHRD